MKINVFHIQAYLIAKIIANLLVIVLTVQL